MPRPAPIFGATFTARPDPKRLGDVRELAVLLTPFEEGIDAHIPAQPMVERKNGLVATVSALALNVASRSSLNGLFHQ